MILLIDNYDSFVYNLDHYLQELGQETHVRRNDALTVPQIRQLAPAAVVLSPGPCDPAKAGICLEVVRELAGELPVLGVCLGLQTIGAAFGGRVVRAPQPMHGRTSQVHHRGRDLFDGISTPFTAMRYHSLMVDRAGLPEVLEMTAWTDDGLIMGLRHRQHLVCGVQFHPESILTQQGHQLLANFLSLAGLPHGPVRTRAAPVLPLSHFEKPFQPWPSSWKALSQPSTRISP